MNSGEFYSEIKRDCDISLRSASEDLPWLRECIRSGTLMQELSSIIKRTFSGEMKKTSEERTNR